MIAQSPQLDGRVDYVVHTAPVAGEKLLALLRGIYPGLAAIDDLTLYDVDAQWGKGNLRKLMDTAFWVADQVHAGAEVTHATLGAALKRRMRQRPPSKAA